MQLNDDLYMLALPMQRDGQTFDLNLSLVLDPAHGPTLVDAGLPGQQDAIDGALAEAGLRVVDLKRIVLTHQDIDHVGGPTYGYSPYFTMWLSEFQRLRLQYTRLEQPGLHENEFFLQWTVVLGSHVHGFRDR